MSFRPTSSATLCSDLCAFAKEIARPEWSDEDRTEMATWLNRKLDELLALDAFGTEGQCDPRGDHRD